MAYDKSYDLLRLRKFHSDFLCNFGSSASIPINTKYFSNGLPTIFEDGFLLIYLILNTGQKHASVVALTRRETYVQFL